MQRVAITGGIASGKSLFARFLAGAGAEVIDADDVVHRLEGPGGAAVPALTALFGGGIIGADGGVDRQALGGLVFGDAAARAKVNALLHPLARAEIARWLARPGGGVRAAVVPLLFEAGWQDGWDAVICLVCGAEAQRRRLTEGRGLTREEAERRIAAQMPEAEKAARSDIVINNKSDAKALAKAAAEVYRQLTERAHEHRARAPRE